MTKPLRHPGPSASALRRARGAYHAAIAAHGHDSGEAYVARHHLVDLLHRQWEARNH